MLLVLFGLAACQKNDDTLYLSSVNAGQLSYLDQWTGVYEGTSHHAYSHPSCPGYTCYVTDHFYKSVVVTVELGTIDSCVNLTIVYDTTTTNIMSNLKVSALGRHYSSWGGGSGAGHLNMSFSSDTLSYNKFQQAGMVSSSVIDFKIKKDNLHKN